MAFAIIKTGGKQYKVRAGSKIRVEKIEGEKGTAIVLDSVLLTADKSSVVIGTPFVKGAKVEASIIRQMRDDKKITFKYSSKARTRRKKGHKQHLTEIEIIKV
ncbi:MAG: 50S ribosomal protein L21 [bacterium]|nr:50S ribosomal protein L21 [Candidatus Jorgensenbacteria bacterium]